MSDPEGLRIALELIAEEAEAKTGLLNLGRLGLSEIPATIKHLSHLTALNLGPYSMHPRFRKWDSEITKWRYPRPEHVG